MKKISLLTCLFLVYAHQTQTNITLNSPLLRIADNAGIFNDPIVDILLTRIDIIALVQGEKEWSGSIIKLPIHNNHHITLEAYFRRPEIIYGATFVAITPDHKNLASLITHDHKKNVDHFLTSIHHKSLYDRQMNATLQGAFTGSYAINPVSKDLLPIYVSDYAIECFDCRQAHTRIGVPAHNSKDFEFAKYHKLPINIVVDVQSKYAGQYDDFGPSVAAPLLDKNGNLKEAYLGEYKKCILKHSDILNEMNLKNGATTVLEYLEKHNLGKAHKELLQYTYNHQKYSMKDIAKIEATVHKNQTQSQHTADQKNELQVILIHAQADFLEIVEKFIINVKNTRTLMIALIEESCSIRKNPHCYLLKWSHFKSDDNEKEVFRRDITSSKDLIIFCKDLVNFLSDLAHSCPNALENLKSQQ